MLTVAPFIHYMPTEQFGNETRSNVGNTQVRDAGHKNSKAFDLLSIIMHRYEIFIHWACVYMFVCTDDDL